MSLRFMWLWKILRCTFYSSVNCIFLYAQLGNFSRISHMTWRSLSRRSFVCMRKSCAFYSSVSCIFLYAPLVDSSRITHIMMTQRSISLAPWRRNQQGTIHPGVLSDIVIGCSLGLHTACQWIPVDGGDSQQRVCSQIRRHKWCTWNPMPARRQDRLRVLAWIGWNSSPSQFCPPRSVNIHLISAIHTIHFLYQPRQAQASTYIPIISIYTIIRLSTINAINTNKRNNLDNWQ